MSSGTCGPSALSKALSFSGVSVTEEEIAALAGHIPGEGTDEVDLDHAARAYGFRVSFERYRTRWGARRALERHSKNATPVLLCLDGWEHWVAVIGRMPFEGYLVADNLYAEMRWNVSERELLDRLKHLRTYDVHPVVRI